MNSMQIEQYLNGKEIPFTHAENTDYCFQLNTLPGSRFRHCNARLSVRSGGRINLTAELPISVNRNEYSGVGAMLAALNENMSSGDSDSAFCFQEGFILDVIEGTIRYEISAWENESADPKPVDALNLRTFVEHIACCSICKWSESILRMVSKESIRLEREERRQRAARIEASRPRSFTERMIDFFGLASITQPMEENESDSMEE